jgi:hypothetical protein
MMAHKQKMDKILIAFFFTIEFMEIILAYRNEVGHPCADCYMYNIRQRSMHINKTSDGVGERYYDMKFFRVYHSNDAKCNAFLNI